MRCVMDVIREFDPWKDPLCTCPAKYGFSPYTGCQHGCIYCFASSYIPDFYTCRPKENLLARVERDISKIDKRRAISMSNSSDPYPPMEAELMLTRECLELFARKNCKLLVITKSDLVMRDADLLSRMRAAVSVTITTLNKELSEKLEPGAPNPERRLIAIRKLTESGVPVSLRLDPIIPFLNEDEIDPIVKAAASCGVKQVTSSTFKPRPDGWRRMQMVFPEQATKMAPLYFEQGKKHHNSWYLPKGLRLELMKRVREACDREGLSFASCREGLRELTTAKTCDGSHLTESSDDYLGISDLQ